MEDGVRACIVADIGGTNARFAYRPRPGAALERIWTTPVRSHAGVAEAIAAWRQAVDLPAGPVAVGLAVATPLDAERDRVRFTNSPWAFSARELALQLPAARVHVLNDFEALAWALPTLGAHQVRAGGALPALERGTLAVVGPGTGLGVGTCVADGRGGWRPLAGEGGHATLQATDDFEAAVIEQARRRLPHVSAERLLSGIGLPLLHACVAAVRGRPVVDLPSERIVEGALVADADAVATMDTFCAMLGAFCGNVALIVGATGGLFIGGGIVPRLGDAFDRSRFRAAFEAKGRYAGYLAAVPTAVITDTLAALGGTAAALDAASRG